MRKISELLSAVMFSVLFTIALIYATLEIPRAISSLLLNVFIDAPDGQVITSLR